MFYNRPVLAVQPLAKGFIWSARNTCIHKNKIHCAVMLRPMQHSTTCARRRQKVAQLGPTNLLGFLDDFHNSF